MILPDINRLYDVTENTWPPASRFEKGAFTIRDGQGGGKRVSAATANGAFSESDIAQAEAEMIALNQPCLFQVREGEADLDKALESRGYSIIDPVNFYAIDASDLCKGAIPRTTAIPCDQPLQIMREIWEQGGIGPARLNVMDRADLPKTTIMGRANDRPGGVAYVGLDHDVAMLHALEILPSHRRLGLARQMMCRAAEWTVKNGGKMLSVVCVQDNVAANGLYQSLGMTHIGCYHYRIKSN